tara:strand:- start:531 stop:1028 length:498 start_codon:yes stop_codon:yes gene_type:complete
VWAVIKIDKNKSSFVMNNIRKKLGDNVQFYLPKIYTQKFKNNKLIEKEFLLLGDYMFLYHEKLNLKKNLYELQFTKGLKYFLDGYFTCQNEIKSFIDFCKKSENQKGHLVPSFFNIILNKNYRFNSGPFCEKIFKIISLQKNKIQILLGDLKTTIDKKEFSFSPI